MHLNDIKKLLAGTIKQSFTNKKTLDKFDDKTGTLKYNGVPVNNAPVFVADDSPVGSIVSFMGNIAPKDYLICDGTEYNISDYPLLTQHFIDEFGSVNYFGGDGETTFAVPDLRGEFLRGTGTATRESGSGSNVGEHQDATSIPYIWGGDTGIGIGGMNTMPQNMDSKSSDSDGFKSITYAATGIKMQNHYTARPTNTSVLYCIKYQITQNNVSKDAIHYSLEEQVIGSWIDGKPLYQKTIINNTSHELKDNEWLKYYDVSALNIDKIINSCIIRNDNTRLSSVDTWYCEEDKYIYLFRTNTINLSMGCTFTIQYTKTTDAENSFTLEMLSSIKTLNTTASKEDVNDVIGGI